MSSVFVTGHMRSGTSMVAGLFQRHGVFFGNYPKRRQFNKKGTFENRWLKKTLEADGMPDDWPDAWVSRLRREGWDGVRPWGAKMVAVFWPEMKQTRPDVVVLCYRPREDILASCEAFGHERRFGREVRGPLIDQHWEIMSRIEASYSGAVVAVETDRLVDGDFGQVAKAFDALDIAFDEEIASEWIDPALWHHG